MTEFLTVHPYLSFATYVVTMVFFTIWVGLWKAPNRKPNPEVTPELIPGSAEREACRHVHFNHSIGRCDDCGYIASDLETPPPKLPEDHDVNLAELDLEEAILHCEELGEKTAPSLCSANHRQLAKWLDELKQRRSQDDVGKRGFAAGFETPEDMTNG